MGINQFEQETKDLLFGVRKSKRYHDKRRSFFEGFQKTKNIFAIIVGSAVLLKVIDSTLLAIAAVIVVIFSAVDIAFSLSNKTRDHAELRKRFINLEAEILEEPELTESELRELQKKRLSIEADEPPVLRVLDAICHNEQVLADGWDESYFLRVEWYQRLLSPVIDFLPQKIKGSSTTLLVESQNESAAQLPTSVELETTHIKGNDD